MEAPRRQNHYTVKQRREVLERVAVERWGPDEQNYKGPGREKQDCIWTRLGHLHEGRTSRGRGMIEYMKMEQGAWIEMYLADKPSSERGLSALMRLCQRFAARHGFSVQKPQYTK
ncbi:hypothetical protein PC116_g24518 [Phytophthora cactorum]|nr:hypothetical protein PC116_g24518 [Phytophthora cactorum]